MRPAAVIVLGLGFGDEGKGTLVDALSRSLGPAAVARFNGGPQASHHVVTAGGEVHAFAQFGAGTLAGEVRTVFGPRAAVDPLAFVREASALERLGVRAPLGRVSLDPSAVVVTPFHRLMNRVQELARGEGRHGSCGMGVGQALLDSQRAGLPSLRVRDLEAGPALRKKLRFLQLVKLDQGEQAAGARPGCSEIEPLLAELSRRDLPEDVAGAYEAFASQIHGIEEGSTIALSGGSAIVLEGAQGALLDAERGFFPYVTPSRTTFGQALDMLGGSPALRLGALRAYSTRHGAGPFVAHVPSLDVALPEAHNVPNPWQGAMRVGWFDLVAARYALDLVGGVDLLAITAVDRLAGLPEIGVVTAYRYDGPADPGLEDLFEIERAAGGPIVRRIKLPAATTLERQAELSRRLSLCSPVVAFRPGWEAWSGAGAKESLSQAAGAYLRYLETELGAPIGLVSVGPGAADKIWTEKGRGLLGALHREKRGV